MSEIERKWILYRLPEIGNQTPLQYERHFLYSENDIEVRIQNKNGVYEFERKVESNILTRSCEKLQITKEEFEVFKRYSIGSIERESYIVEGISIKVYKGVHEGLIRAEVEFDTEQEASGYTPPEWFGVEITHSELGRDKKLSKLSRDEFIKILDDVSSAKSQQ